MGRGRWGDICRVESPKRRLSSGSEHSHPPRPWLGWAGAGRPLLVHGEAVRIEFVQQQHEGLMLVSSREEPAQWLFCLPLVGSGGPAELGQEGATAPDSRAPDRPQGCACPGQGGGVRLGSPGLALTLLGQ